MIARDIAWLQSGADRKLMARHVLGMFAVFLYAYYVAWSMKPEWLEVAIGFGLIGVNGALTRSLEGLLSKTDMQAAKLTGDPEALITGLAKLERAQLRVIRAGLKKRLKAIASNTGIDEEKLAALVDQTSGAGDRYPVPGVNYGEMTVVC